MSQPSDADALAPSAPPSAPSLGRRGILALVDRPMVVAFVATLGVLGGLVIGSGIASITTIIIYIVLALFVALALDPLVRVLERRGMKRGASIGIVFGAFAVLAVLFFVFVLPPIVSQVGSFIRNLPEAIAGVVDADWFLALSPDLQDAVAAGLDEVAVALAKPETIAAIGGGALALGIGLVSAISAGFIVVALTLYFLASLTGMKEALYAVAPARDRPTLRDMTERVTASVGKSLLGSVTLALINASVVFVLQVVIGLPYPALMAFLAFIITLVPLFGSVIFWVIATLAALLSSPEQAVIFGVAYLIYIQIESYVVTPRVMTKAIAIPAALVLIGAMVGGTLGGVIGVLVALPVMASILLVIREIVVPKQDLKV
ncbi:MAG: AI-2E family transporter [Microbacterium sp.]